MRSIRLSLTGHLLLLLLVFVPSVTALYLLPTLLAGYPFDISPLLLARNVGATGLFSFTDVLGRFLSTDGIQSIGIISAADGRLSALLFAAFSQWISWQSLTGFSVLSAALTAFSCIPLWFAVRKIFDTRIAWSTVAIFAFLPLTWKQALFLENYHFAILFLLLSVATFVIFSSRLHFATLCISAIFFGASIAAKDVFLIFVPWFLCGYLWENHREWKRGVLGIFLFLAMSGCVYLLPYVHDIRTLGYPVNQNLARVWPGAEEIGDEIYLHLYPDPYTYTQDRERFDTELVESLPDLSSLERLQKEKILLNFRIGQQSIFRSLMNGAWLFIGTIPSFFHQATIGGILFWFLLIPGFYTLWKRKRHLAIHATGLIVSAFLIIRFVLQFSREHLMDVTWIFAVVAGVGIATIAHTISEKRKTLSPVFLMSVITMFFCIHLLQVDRIETGRLFRTSIVPRTLAIVSTMKDVPEDAVIAVAGHANLAHQYAFLSNRSIVLFQEQTIERLMDERKLQEAFNLYGITHAMFYSTSLAEKMQIAVPRITVLSQEDVPPSAPVQTDAALRFLLHVIR